MAGTFLTQKHKTQTENRLGDKEIKVQGKAQIFASLTKNRVMKVYRGVKVFSGWNWSA
jgi:hypothetical protein